MEAVAEIPPQDDIVRVGPGQSLPVNWEEIKHVMCSTAMTFQEAEAKYKISHWSIRKRAEREEWPLPDVVAKRAQEILDQKAKSNGVQKVDLIKEMAENWAEKGINHRGLAFRIASKAMQGIENAPPEVKDWADVERVDKLARRAAGLDTSESTVSNSFNFTMLGERMEVEAPVIEIPAQDVGELPE